MRARWSLRPHELLGRRDLLGGRADARVEHELLERLQRRHLGAGDDGLPGLAPAAINGVSAGRATTSNTTDAAAICPSVNDSACSSAPPAMPIGVMFTMMSAVAASASAVQANP